MASHPSHEHPLVQVDSSTFYPEFDGRWKCDKCTQEYTRANRPYHCGPCSFDLCESCYGTKQHIRHEHPLYLMKMIDIYPHYNGQWKCDGCGQNKMSQQEPNGFHCFIDQFDLCKKCFYGYQTSVHTHPLTPADAGIVYNNAPGLWACDICRRSGTQLRTRYSWHCSVCQFDCCNYCLQEVTIPDHPHPLKITDSFIVYSNYGGHWGCDICRRDQNPTQEQIYTSKPYHCSQCAFDACHDCVAVHLRDPLMGEEVTGPPPEVHGQPPTRSGVLGSDKPHVPPVEEY